jgi:diguanylate cyclase (GGDEF)-like protein
MMPVRVTGVRMATATTAPSSIRALGLRQVPRPMRWLLAAVSVAAAAGFVLAVLLTGWSGIAGTLSEPSLWTLLGVIVLADLYPLVPWMRDIQGRVRMHWSGALSLAMLIGFGPATLVLFPLIGLMAVSSLGGAWWRKVFNIGVVVTEGLVGAAVLQLARGGGGNQPPSVGVLLVAGTLLALVWEVVNVALIGTAIAVTEGTAWWPTVKAGLRGTVMWLATLVTAPMIAELAVRAPAMLPGIAVVVIAVHHSVATLTRRHDEARTDPLTGLANRAAVMELLDRSLLRPDRRENPITMMLIDLDGFKAVNDTHGHHAGDLVLAEIGARISAAAAPGSLVARLGGDEFVVVCAGLPDAAALADGIRAVVGMPLSVRPALVSVGCSIGWARALPGTDPMDLFRLVDRNLYRFKNSGPGHVADQDVSR